VIRHPLADDIAAVRRELDALERDPAPTTPDARYGSSRLLRRAAEAVVSARHAAARGAL
tara:strand:- start:1286 stop:1462 length:177 start_codon:yes stop_codon:yes gene_type:complete